MVRSGWGLVPAVPQQEGGKVSLRLRDVFPLLDQARRSDLTWLRDMGDDVIEVTPDLAEILGAYRAIIEERRRA